MPTPLAERFREMVTFVYPAAAAVVLFLILVATWCWLHRRYRHTIETTVSQFNKYVDAAGRDFLELRPPQAVDFSAHIVCLTGLLPLGLHKLLAGEVARIVEDERSYIPYHKAGGTLSYQSLIRLAPGVVAFYQSPYLRQLISSIVGESVMTTPLWDQSSCSILKYTKPGDRIGWHYDHNFYRGRHFTALYVLNNHGPNGLSSAQLQTRAVGEVKTYPTEEGSLVVFEGCRVFHRVTPLAAGEYRVMLSMTFTTDPGNSFLQGVLRRLKDVAYFGPRALWT
ncbi:MAG: 2OG-Fe(II) oxygenase [Pseudomonadales bacterium]